MNRFSKILLTAAIAGWNIHAYAGIEDAYEKTADPKKRAAMEKGMETVRAKLKHPESADFKNVFFHTGIDGLGMTCGEIRFKDEGGKTESTQRFMSAGKLEYTYLQQDLKDFDPTWRQFCQ